MSQSEDLAISVVIPTRARETRLAFALEALASQTLDPELFEVLVVRDSDAVPPLASAPTELRVRFLTSPGVSGPTVKREVGWRAAFGRVIAFTDDDCRPSPGWLEAVLDRNPKTAPEVIVQGKTIPDPDEAHLLYGMARSQHVDGPSNWYPTCNIAYPRALLERLGGFDPSFYFGGEDTDLGLRARDAGATVTYAPEALVSHAVLARPVSVAVRDAFRWPSLPLVVRRHPSHRAALYAPWAWKRRHVTILAALAGIGMSRRHRIALMACVPYIKDVMETEASPTPAALVRQASHVPAIALTDLAEVVATIAASAKHRVFLV